MAASDIKPALLATLRQAVADAAEYGEYKLGTAAWHRAGFVDKGVLLNGAAQIVLKVEADASGDPATAFRVCDAGGNVLLEKTETVPFAMGDSYIAYRFRIGVTAVDEEAEEE